MPIGPARLSLLPFPQLWDGDSLKVRFLCLPKGDPLLGPLIPAVAPDNKAALFLELTKQFNITRVRVPSLTTPQFRKSLTESYGALIGNRRRSQYLADSAEFACALHQGAQDQPDPVVLSDSVTWGKVIAFGLRQPNLAVGLGLLVGPTVQPPTADFLAKGGRPYTALPATR